MQKNRIVVLLSCLLWIFPTVATAEQSLLRCGAYHSLSFVIYRNHEKITGDTPDPIRLVLLKSKLNLYLYLAAEKFDVGPEGIPEIEAKVRSVVKEIQKEDQTNGAPDILDSEYLEVYNRQKTDECDSFFADQIEKAMNDPSALRILMDLQDN